MLVADIEMDVSPIRQFAAGASHDLLEMGPRLLILVVLNGASPPRSFAQPVQ